MQIWTLLICRVFYRKDSIKPPGGLFVRNYIVGGGLLEEGLNRRGINGVFTVEETRVVNKYLGIFVDYMCFSWEKVYKKIEAQAKSKSCI